MDNERYKAWLHRRLEKSAGKGPGGAAEQSGLLGDGVRAVSWRGRREEGGAMTRAMQGPCEEIEQTCLFRWAAMESGAHPELALLMDANFGRNDLHVTLTYRGTPPDYEQARKDVRNYLRAVKRMREKAGLPEMKYIYVLEEEGGDGEKRRIHVHLMMTGGISREALEEKWGRGYANCDRLQPEEGTGLLELARYFTKQGMEKHRRAWSASKNLRQPRTTVSRTRMSNARVRRLCQEMPGNAAEIMGQLYPAYKLGAVEPYVSDWIPGVYLRIRLRRRCA